MTDLEATDAGFRAWNEAFISSHREANEAFYAARDAGDLDGAARVHREARGRGTRLAGQYLVELGFLALERGRPGAARRYAREAIAAGDQIGARFLIALSWLVLLPPLWPSYAVFLWASAVNARLLGRNWFAAATLAAPALALALVYRVTAPLLMGPALARQSLLFVAGCALFWFMSSAFVEIARIIQDRD